MMPSYFEMMPSFYLIPDLVTNWIMHRGDIKLLKYNLKVPHQTQTPFKLEISSGSEVGVCKLKLIHIGKHLPGIKDPNKGLLTKHNSSHVLNKNFSEASIEFDMVTNWGRGPFSRDISLEDDTLQIGVFLSHFEEVSGVCHSFGVYKSQFK